MQYFKLVSITTIVAPRWHYSAGVLVILSTLFTAFQIQAVTRSSMSFMRGSEGQSLDLTTDAVIPDTFLEKLSNLLILQADIYQLKE